MQSNEVRSAQVVNQLDNLAKQLDELENAIGILTDRLQCVLREEDGVNPTPKAEESLVSLAADIRGSVFKVVSLTDVVKSAHERLEI